jgi:uncharacterized protein YndB with AHSA1/START domain
VTDNADRRIRVLGRLGSAEGRGVVHIEDRYDTDIDDLWSAVTDPARLARWYGDVEGDLRQGGRFTLYLAGPDLHAVGRVEVCDAPGQLRVVTRETDESAQRGNGAPPFDQTVEATLTADAGQTVLVIEIRGMPVDTVASYGAGWQIHAENLAAYLAGREPGDTGGRWGELAAPYQELATTIR